MTLIERINQPGPKKILALDGGGICGLASIEVLATIETMLRQQLDRGDDFVLGDYFDLIAGTSTGAVIAACLSYGMTVANVRSFYEESGREMFDRAALITRLARYKYDDDNISAKLREVLGSDTLLGTDRLRSVLMMVMRNATTDSPWPIWNNPRARYNDPLRANCNLKLPLWKLVRASTAAPTYFPPEVIEVGGQQFVFVDGGVTTYNNPAWLAFLMATVEPYGLSWATGEDNMLMVSVGTGNYPAANDALTPGAMNILYNATTIPGALMNAALAGNDLNCRALGRCLVGNPIDREAGDLIGGSGNALPKLFTYMRYDFETTREGMARIGLPDIKPENVRMLDSIDYMPELKAIGQAVGRLYVDPAHYRKFA